MRSSRSRRVARAVGGALGLALAVAVVLNARPSANADALTATVRFSVRPSGELAVTPSSPQPVLVATSLRPGGNRAVGGFDVRNQAAGPTALEFRAPPASNALDRFIRVRLSVGGQTLARTSLQDMRAGVAAPVRLPAGATWRVSLEAWMPAAVGDSYEGGTVDVSLLLAGSGAR